MTETPAEAVAPKDDTAALFAEMRAEIERLSAQVAAKPDAAPVTPETFDRAKEYDDTDDEPMVVFRQPQGEGMNVLQHRVKVSEWPAYEARYGL